MSEYPTNSDAESGRQAALRDLCARARPPEPTEAEWDGVWSNVVAALDAPAVVPMPEPRWSVVARLSWRVLAQAAAVLLMASLVVARYRSGLAPDAPGPIAQHTDPPATLAVVDIPEGELTVIHIGPDGLSTTELVPDDRPNALDELYAFLNRMEASGDYVWHP